MKVVSGAPNIRPAWFFDTAEQGEGLNDIGTHLVDLVQWTLFPDQAIDYRADVQVLSAQRWPTMISPRHDFQRVTREPRFPDSLVRRGQGRYARVLLQHAGVVRARGVHTKLNVIWDWEPPAGSGDTHFAFYRGTRARVEVRQGAGRPLPARALRDPGRGRARRQVLAAVRRTGRGAAADVSRRRRRGSRRRDPHRDSRTRSASATRRTSRR